MEKIVLKQDIIKRIKSDPVLYGLVAQALCLKPVSLISLLANNHIKLTQAGVLKVIREYLDVQDNALLEKTIEKNVIHA